MAIITPAKGRAQINNTSNGLNITIPAKKNWFIIIFLSIWLCGWFFGETSAIHTLLHDIDRHTGSFLFIWLAGWTVGGIFAGTVLAWNLAGAERITLYNNILNIERKALNIGITKQYSLQDASNFRISTPLNIWSYNNWGSGLEFWGLGGGQLSFDYGMQTIRFGSSIDEAEANHILRELKSYGYIKS